MIKYSVTLFMICLCAALVLSVTYQFTHSRIEAQLVSEEKDALGEVFVGASEFQKSVLGERDYYLVKKGNDSIGYIIKIEAKGYGGIITMLVGFDLNGEIEGIRILSQSETPGLGAKVNEVRYGEDSPWFLRQFKGKKVEELELGDNVQAITAATISSRAVLDSVKKEACKFLDEINN